jgi:hypothetical protein
MSSLSVFRHVFTLAYTFSNLFFALISLCKLSCFIHSEITSNMQECIRIYYSMFIRSSTCFERHTAHHQEHKNCTSSLWFYMRVRLLDVEVAGRCRVNLYGIYTYIYIYIYIYKHGKVSNKDPSHISTVEFNYI